MSWLRLMFLLVLLAPASQAPTVDLCALLERPPEYRGRIVTVSGEYNEGPHSRTLRGECGEALRGERVCVEYAPSKARDRSSSTDDRTVAAYAEVSPIELSEAFREDRLPSLLDSLQWTPLQYEPVERQQDELWEEFERVRSSEPGSAWNVTLVGRFEYVNTPTYIQYSDGSRAYVTGYGLRDSACHSRLVVTKVLSLEALDEREQQWEQ